MSTSNNSRIVKLAAAQFSRRLGDKEYNIERASQLIRDAAKEGADLVALPELFSTGYFPTTTDNDEFYSWAEPISGPTTDALQRVAASENVYVVAGIYELEPVRRLFFNAAALIGPDGVVGRYRKRHLPAIPDMFEKYYFAPGDLQYPVYRTPKCIVGMSICYDRHFPETFRHMALRGGEVAVSINNTPTARSKRMWFTEIEAAASSNGMAIVQCNVTAEPERPFFGQSTVISPLGEVVAKLGDEEGVVVAAVDLGEIAKARLHYGAIRDARMSDFSFGDDELPPAIVEGPSALHATTSA
jgi:N-carbamoylputrescine amidase